MDQIRFVIDPALTIFPVVNDLGYIKRYKHHKAYM